MARLNILCDFIFDSNKNVLLTLDVYYENKPVPLVLSSLMSFLFENEKELNSDDLEFGYLLAKCVKKVQIGPQFLLAVPDDYSMALLFKKIIELRLLVIWKKTGKPILTNAPLPLTLRLDSKQTLLMCKLLERNAFIKDPFMWLVLDDKKDRLVFCHGVLMSNVPDQLTDFMAEFMHKPVLTFRGPDALRFIQNVYTPFKKRIQWQIKANLNAFVPKTVSPIPVLTLNYHAPILMPQLAYQYGRQIVEPDEPKILIEDGKLRYERLKDMEAIYQDDLMQLFTEHQLPFMLQSPGDIAKFMDTLVPILISRQWLVTSHVPEFKVQEKPIDLEFNLHSTGTDWFHFEPNVTVNGQPFSLQEMARVIVEQNGYIKTKIGFVKVSESSQKELSTLNQLGAFKTGKQFSRRDVIPLIASASVLSKTEDAKHLIHAIKEATYKDQCVPDKDFKAVLRPYQQQGVNWMNQLYRLELGGILADDMGLGKTIQALAFCSQLKETQPVLVVGPTSVVYNWKQEIERWLPKQKVLIYTGSSRETSAKKLGQVNFVITSYGVLKNDIDLLSAIPFKAIFVDEAQAIKNPSTQVSKAVKRLKSRFKLAMTGTPIENHLTDIWNLFDFVMPDFLGTEGAFNALVSDQGKELLKTKIKPFVMRREKREVLDSLPEKTEMVVRCPMNEFQTKLYKTVLDAVKQGIRDSTGKTKKLNILTSLLKLRQVCTHPGLLKELQLLDAESSKLEMAKEKLEELIDEGHKIVVFTQFQGVLDHLENWCKNQHIYSERLDGSVSSKLRMDSINRFQESEKPGVFIVSLKAGGVGINLTAASYVFHLDPWWNPAIESQATDRVHRMGQTQKVMVYKFISEGTIEEKIQDLQDSKRQLLHQIIELDSEFESKNLSLDTLVELIETP